MVAECARDSRAGVLSISSYLMREAIITFETIRKVILEPNREAIEEVISRTC
jgi:hypothetical protein